MPAGLGVRVLRQPGLELPLRLTLLPPRAPALPVSPSGRNLLIMSLEPPTYLSSLQNNIRARPIPWEGAVRAGSITDDHLKKIKAVDKVRKEQRCQTVEGDRQGYVSLLAGGADRKSVLDSASKRTDIVQYILVLAADLINGANLHSPLLSYMHTGSLT